jgi:hypothetical protein
MSFVGQINHLRAANRELDSKIACLLYLKDLSNYIRGEEGLREDCNPGRTGELRIEEGKGGAIRS